MCINFRTIWSRCSTPKIKHILFISVRVVYVCLLLLFLPLPLFFYTFSLTLYLYLSLPLPLYMRVSHDACTPLQIARKKIYTKSEKKKKPTPSKHIVEIYWEYADSKMLPFMLSSSHRLLLNLSMASLLFDHFPYKMLVLSFSTHVAFFAS